MAAIGFKSRPLCPCGKRIPYLLDTEVRGAPSQSGIEPEFLGYRARGHTVPKVTAFHCWTSVNNNTENKTMVIL
jgi:hypothetical protein